MLGDQQDMLGRIKAVLPLQWFPETTPVLDTVLAGVAWAWAWVYELLQAVVNQTRLATAQADWLDLIAWDFFGPDLARRANESDDAYRGRIQAESDSRTWHKARDHHFAGGPYRAPADAV